jgi:TPR repeat protein
MINSITCLSTLSLGTPAYADYLTGVDAYNSGDYVTALKEWKPLADQGNADAQFNLGWMYHTGHGWKITLPTYSTDQAVMLGHYLWLLSAKLSNPSHPRPQKNRGGVSRE